MSNSEHAIMVDPKVSAVGVIDPSVHEALPKIVLQPAIMDIPSGVNVNTISLPSAVGEVVPSEVTSVATKVRPLKSVDEELSLLHPVATAPTSKNVNMAPTIFFIEKG